MIKRARLDSLEIRNYLGAGDEPVTLEFNGKHAVLCGPNGSGKTTVLSALDRVRRIKLSKTVSKSSRGVKQTVPLVRIHASPPASPRCSRFSRNLREIPAFGGYSSSVGLKGGSDIYFSAT